MPEYLILIYEDEAPYANPGDDVWQQAMKAHMEFGTINQKSLRGGAALQPAATATSIRLAPSGTPTITDGPFYETKEALGGYYLIEAADLDEAIAIAKQVPAPYGGVEVRPVMVFDQE